MACFINQEQAEERRQRLEEEQRMDPAALQQLKETEAKANEHDHSKTAHYAQLGKAFAVTKGPGLLGGGRGGGRGRGGGGSDRSTIGTRPF